MTWQFLAAGSLIPTGLVLTWMIQSTALLAVGLLAGHLLRKRGPAVQSALYRTTLGAVILCPVASLSMAAMGFSGLPIRLPASSEGDRNPLANEHPGREMQRSIDGNRARSHLDDALPARTAQTFVTPMSPDISPDQESEAGVAPPRVASVPLPIASDASPRWADRIGWVGTPIMAAWLLGAAGLGIRLWIGHRRMARLRSSAIEAEPDVLATCRNLARQMHLSAPSVLRSPFLCSPCLVGLRRPAILLPEDAEENLRETFIHELAHLGRRDGLWNLLRHVATAVFWMQPLLWFLSKRLEATAEEVCDDYVVGFGADRCRYAGHLLELAERRLPPLSPSGVGMISLRSLLARRIARILDSTRTLSTRAGRRAIAATLLAGLAGTLLVGLLGVGGQDRAVLGDQPKVAKTSATDPDSSPTSANTSKATKTVNGRVVDPDGNPVAGATVTAGRYRRNIASLNQYEERQELDRTTTDREGRFRVTFEDAGVSASEDEELSRPWGRPVIVAWAPGFGPAWLEGLARDVTEDKPIRLVRDDVPITGRVVDRQGRPIREASIWVHMDGRLPGLEPAVSSPATTDRDGRFRLTGLGRDRLAILDIRGPSIAFRRFRVMTRPMKLQEGLVNRWPPLFDGSTHGADCTIVVDPGQPIEGVVRDTETKEPIPGAIVGVESLAGTHWDIGGLVSAQADDQGRYRLVGLPKGNGHTLRVYPPIDRPYFTTAFKAPAGPGFEPVRCDVSLKRGIWITGRVTDGKTGKPAQAAIHYYPFFSNTLAEAFPNFQPKRIDRNWTGSRYRTDAEGRYRVVGLPDRGIVAARSFERSYLPGIGGETIPERPSHQPNRGGEGLPTYNLIHPRDFNAVSVVNPSFDAKEFHRDLVLQPGSSMTVQLLDPEGKPLTQGTAWGRFPHDRDFGNHNLFDQSRIQVSGLVSAEARTVLFLHKGRKLGAVLVIEPVDVSDGAERTVTLRPCGTVTGRIVDTNGKPVTGGIRIRLTYEGDPPPTGSGFAGLELSHHPLDADGRFRIDNMAPGGRYVLQATNRPIDRPRMEPAFDPFEVARDLKAEQGQVIDLGTFNARTGRRIQEPEKPTTAKSEQRKAATHMMPITGRIVDFEGRPVGGATVQVTQITKSKGDNLDPWFEAVKRGEPPWFAQDQLSFEPTVGPEEKRSSATTDVQGRFQFEGIAAERVVHLVIQGPTISYTALDVVTRRTEPIPAKGFPSNYGSEAQRVYGADFTYTAAPGRPVEGVVRDARTNQPLAGVEVVTEHFAGAAIFGIRDLKTTTDGQGRFRLVGLPKGSGNVITAIPNVEQPYFVHEFPVPDPPGIAPVQVEIDLHQGIWIEGKVSDKETGEPVPGAWLYYLPFLDNPFARATPEFDKNGNGPGTTHQDRYQTKSDGTYRLVGLAGHAIVGVDSRSQKPYLMGDGAAEIKGINKHGHFETWTNPLNPSKLWPTSMKEINPTAATNGIHLDFQLDSGAKVRMRVIDLQGKSVTGLKLAGRTQRGRPESDVRPEAEFDVLTLASGEERMVMVRQEERKLGKVVHVKPGDDKDGPVTVTLEPTATIVGRVTDADGNPVSGVTIQSHPHPVGDFSLRLGPVASGKEGRFVLPDVPIGCQYSLLAESGYTVQDRRVGFSGNATVRAGESTDVGEIRLPRDPSP